MLRRTSADYYFLLLPCEDIAKFVKPEQHSVNEASTVSGK